MYDNNELYHFGVKGMKWGVRHEREKTGRQRGKRQAPLAARAFRAAITPFYKTAAANQIISEGKRDRQLQGLKNIANAKGGKAKLKAAIMGPSAAQLKRIDARTQRRLSKVALTKTGKKINETNAWNLEKEAEYYDKRSKMKGKEKIKEILTKKEYYKTPYKHLDGEITTIGKEKLRSLRNRVIWNMAASGGKIAYRAYKSRQNTGTIDIDYKELD